MTEVFDNMDPEDLDGSLLPQIEELDGLPDVLGDYAEPEVDIDE